MSAPRVTPAAPLAIGPLTLGGQTVLAPMSGISDWPFRFIAARFGAPLVVSEMVPSERLVAADALSAIKTEGRGIVPHAVQLAGCRADVLAQGARIAEDGGAHLIDINMGCPAKKVFGGFAGSALMGDLDHATRLIEAVVGAVRVPVTVKMRLGLCAHSHNAAELARRAEGAGAALVTVHGRTRAQKYKGCADWAAVAPVVQAVGIPVIVNGDCTGIDDARKMLRASGAAGVMVGRATLGAPWRVAQIDAALMGRAAPAVPQTPAAIAAIAAEHFALMRETVPARLATRLFKKHLAAYADHFALPAPLRQMALTAEDAAATAAAIGPLFAAAEPTVQAAA
ncbi:MAG: tRNA dihydrouridine synthase DusB [Pseudomonadota bacterium]